MPPARAIAADRAAGDLPLLAADSAESLFDLIGRSELIGRGQAMLVSIAPVKAALGERWAARRQQIYDLTERHLERHLSPADICERASETHFLVATPDRATMFTQALCYRALTDILTYFLGEALPQDLDVSLVKELTSRGVKVRPIPVAELRKAHAEAGLPAPAAPRLSPLTSLVSWPLMTVDGDDLRVSFAVDPVLDLKAWAMAGHRIDSRIVDVATGVELNGAERRNLLPRDFERIDLAALERGLSRLGDAEHFERPKLIIQLSFASLSNGRVRAVLLNRARELQNVLRQGAICELTDLEPGVPEGRLGEVASLVRSFFRSVWAQVEPTKAAIEAAMAANVSGLIVRASDLGRDDKAIAAGLRRCVPMLKRQRLILMAASLPSADLLIDAMAAGFTHATLRARATDDVAASPPAHPET